MFGCEGEPAYAKASAGEGGEGGIASGDPGRGLKPNHCPALSCLSFLF